MYMHPESGEMEPPQSVKVFAHPTPDDFSQEVSDPVMAEHDCYLVAPSVNGNKFVEEHLLVSEIVHEGERTEDDHFHGTCSVHVAAVHVL